MSTARPACLVAARNRFVSSRDASRIPALSCSVPSSVSLMGRPFGGFFCSSGGRSGSSMKSSSWLGGTRRLGGTNGNTPAFANGSTQTSPLSFRYSAAWSKRGGGSPIARAFSVSRFSFSRRSACSSSCLVVPATGSRAHVCVSMRSTCLGWCCFQPSETFGQSLSGAGAGATSQSHATEPSTTASSQPRCFSFRASSNASCGTRWYNTGCFPSVSLRIVIRPSTPRHRHQKKPPCSGSRRKYSTVSMPAYVESLRARAARFLARDSVLHRSSCSSSQFVPSRGPRNRSVGACVFGPRSCVTLYPGRYTYERWSSSDMSFFDAGRGVSLGASTRRRPPGETSTAASRGISSITIARRGREARAQRLTPHPAHAHARLGVARDVR